MVRGRAARRSLIGVLAVTVVVVLSDLSGAAWTAHLRSAAAAALGPVLRAASPPPDADAVAVQQAAEHARRDQATLDELADLSALLQAPEVAGARLVPASVVGVSAAGTGAIERLTIDVGARDGVRTDQSVVTVDGLIGRTVMVGPWTSDVMVLGAADLSVGVRVGPQGHLGLLTASPTQAGGLRVDLAHSGELSVGDRISTLGSPSGTPFAPGLPVGTVSSIDSARGALTAGGTARPAVDLGTVRVVGVLLSSPRATPRPSVSAGQP